MSAGPFVQQGINYYVPNMQQAPGIGDDNLYTASLGTPIAAAVNTIIITANGAITNAAKVFNAASAGLGTVFPFLIDAVFGRAVSITGATAGDNAVITVRGVDYLGQPTTENITLNGTTTVQGVKMFKRVDSLSVAAGNANASSSIQVGVGSRLGLPFKTGVILVELSNDASATVGTLVAPNTTDPATATTSEPRGHYTPSSTLNGTNVITIVGRSSKLLNGNGNGGFHGIRQFFT